MVCGIEIEHPRIALTIGGWLSVASISFIFVLVYYYKIPTLIKHPTTMAIQKCWFELLFISQYLWMSFPSDSFWWSTTGRHASDCVAREYLWPFCWLTQFTLLGGELWFAAMSIDIHISLTNPFSSYKRNFKKYQWMVYSLSFITATLLVTYRPREYGLSYEPMIWVDVAGESTRTNYMKIFMFYSWMAVIYIYCTRIAYWSRFQIYKGLEATLMTRKYTVSKQTRYVIGYIAFWTVVFVLEMLNYADTALDESLLSRNSAKAVRTAGGFILASRGVWSLVIFLEANKKDIRSFFEGKNISDKLQQQEDIRASESDLEQGTVNIESIRASAITVDSVSNRSTVPMSAEQEQLQLNIALQKEIVRFTVLGIQKSVRDMEEIITRSGQHDQLMLRMINSNSNTRSTNSLSRHSAFFLRRLVDEASTFTVSDPVAAEEEFKQNEIDHQRQSQLERMKQIHNKNDSDKPPLRRSMSNGVRDSIESQPADTRARMNSILDDLSRTAEQAANDRDSLEEKSDNSDGRKMSGENPSIGPRKSFRERLFSFPMSPSAPLVAQEEDLQKFSTRASITSRSEMTNFAYENSQMRRRDSSDSNSSHSVHSIRESYLSLMSNRILENISTRIKRRITRKKVSFMFTDYSARRFAQIRHLSGISNDDYLQSFERTTMPNFSEGKSGAFIYFSSDRKYIVKTTSESEFEKLLSIIPSYEQYLINESSKGRKPLLTRYLGAHRIIMYDIPLYFVIMQNICPAVDEKYDLKGSWVNRYGSKKDSDRIKVTRPKKYTQPYNVDGTKPIDKKKQGKDGATLFLDNDLQQCFLLRQEDSRELAEQIARDTKFLADFNIMDYSLLVGIKRRNFTVMNLENGHLYNTYTSSSSMDQHDFPVRDSLSSRSKHMENDVTFSSDVLTKHSNRAGGDDSGKTLVLDSRDKTFGALSLGKPFHAAVVEGQGSFYIGIIDILQEWNWEKWRETTFKTLVLRKDKHGISSMEPVGYRKRFFQRAVVDVLDGLGEGDISLLQSATIGMYNAAPLDTNLFRESLVRTIDANNNNNSEIRKEGGSEEVPCDEEEEYSDSDVISPLPQSQHDNIENTKIIIEEEKRNDKIVRPMSVDTIGEGINYSSSQPSEISTRDSDARFAVRPLSSSESVQ